MTAPTDVGADRSATLPCQFCGTWNRVDASRFADRPKCGSCAKPMLLDRPFALTDDSFARVIADATIPVLVDFYADWCGPCKMMAPDIDAFASKHAGRVFTAKLDTDRNQATARRFNIMSIPTSMRFEAGAKSAEHAGAMRLSQIEEFAGVK